jgi:putative acetyltransferase
VIAGSTLHYPVKIRPFKLSDTPSVVKVYRDAVRRIGPIAYSPEQIAAWSRYPTDELDFGYRLTQGHTLVMEENRIIYAFGQLHPRNCFAFLYTTGDTHKKGLGTQLYDALEAHAFSSGVIDMHTEVSRIARPFFEKRGFTLDEVVRNIHFGVEFEWYRLSRSRDAARAYRLGRLPSVVYTQRNHSLTNEQPPVRKWPSAARGRSILCNDTVEAAVAKEYHQPRRARTTR